MKMVEPEYFNVISTMRIYVVYFIQIKKMNFKSHNIYLIANTNNECSHSTNFTRGSERLNRKTKKKKKSIKIKMFHIFQNLFILIF